MKKIILMLVFCNLTYANYQKIEEVKTCSVKKVCKRNCGAEYLKVPLGFVCERYDLVKEYEKDFTKPIESCETNTETQEEVCLVTDYEDAETFKWKVVKNPEKEEAHKEKLKKENDLKLAMDKEKANISFGQDLYSAIKIKNRERGLTKEQRMDLIEELATIRDLLLAGDLDLALSEVKKIDTEASQVNQEDIDYVISELNKRLGSE